MKFYIQITEEHQSDNGEYTPIRDGTLKLFTEDTYDNTPKHKRLSKNLSEVNKDELVELEIDNALIDENKIIAFKARLDSDKYNQDPIIIKNKTTQPLICQGKICHQTLRFAKSKGVLIGIIKAYKKDSQSNIFKEDSNGISNTKNEIYTIDIKQEIQLRAFLYDEQKYYVGTVTDENTQTRRMHASQQGNITKTIITNSTIANNIQWAFKIVDGTYKADNGTTRDIAFPTLGINKPITISTKETRTTRFNKNKLNSIPKGYVTLENLKGDCVNISLSDIFDNNTLKSLVNKNIIFFAYNEAIINPTSGDGVTIESDKIIDINNAYSRYNILAEKNKWKERKITKDRVTSVELKILKTRFRLEFDGEFLSLLENERELKQWQARSGKAINNFNENSNEIKTMNRVSIPHTDKTSFYYDLALHTQDSTKPLREGRYFVKIPSNFIYDMDILSLNIYSDIALENNIAKINIERFKINDNSNIANANINVNANANANANANETAFISYLKEYFSEKNITLESIPLTIKYQKRILILIERFKQTTQFTKGRMNIYLDGKRVDSSGKFTNDNDVFNKIFDIARPYAYILERNGPDSIGGDLRLRIPEGRYKIAKWHNNNDNIGNDGFNQNTLKLKNDFVGENRNILIHNGASPKNSDGCLLISKTLVKSKQTKKIIDYALDPDRETKRDLAKAIKKDGTKIGFIDEYLFGSDIKTNRSTPTQVIKHIEIRIKNVL